MMNFTSLLVRVCELTSKPAFRQAGTCRDLSVFWDFQDRVDRFVFHFGKGLEMDPMGYQVIAVKICLKKWGIRSML
jgi:hypothetical protein